MRTGLRALMVAVGALGVGSVWASEPGCYLTSAEAAVQEGVRGSQGGYRLESVRRDVFSGITWATVRSCRHPEQPGVLVLASTNTGGASAAAAGVALRYETAAVRTLVMLAGTRVRLLEKSENVQLEVSATALSSGAVGDQVRVRLVPVSSDGGSDGATSWGTNERFATGIVRSRDVVEVGAR